MHTEYLVLEYFPDPSNQSTKLSQPKSNSEYNDLTTLTPTSANLTPGKNAPMRR